MRYPLRRLAIYAGVWGALLPLASFSLGLLPSRGIRIFSLACVAFVLAFVLRQDVNETTHLFLRTRPGCDESRLACPGLPGASCAAQVASRARPV